VYTIRRDRDKVKLKRGNDMAENWDWENRYRTNDIPWDTGQPSSELLRVVTEDAIQPCAALEVGCGTGTNAIWLAQQGFDVTAVDISQLAIERARAKATAAGVSVRFMVGNLATMPELVGPFDFLFDRGLYHILRTVDLPGYLRILERTVNPGALGLVLTGNARLPRTGPPIVSEDEIRAELGRLFEIVRLREIQFDPVGGQTHLGWSCLLRRQA
jgi:2-polyprenyl-3-methyl-5-hydroxy-6-metoxy-1,4-benzoquinol methylase